MITLETKHTFIGSVHIFKDSETGNTVELMNQQLSSILRSDCSTGELPHASWNLDKSGLTVSHDEDPEIHTMHITYEDMERLFN